MIGFALVPPTGDPNQLIQFKCFGAVKGAECGDIMREEHIYDHARAIHSDTEVMVNASLGSSTGVNPLSNIQRSAIRDERSLDMCNPLRHSL